MQRENGLVHVLTGDGNGKTTSAIGIAVRASGRGLRVAFVQFLKGGFSGEVPSLRKLGVEVITGTKHCPNSSKHESQLAEKGFAIFCKDCFAINEKDRALTKDAFAKASEFSSSGEYDLVVLDEIFWVVLEKLISEQELLQLIEAKSRGCELILTGRGATKEIEEAADYVTYVGKVKHPFDKGVLARSGVDY